VVAAFGFIATPASRNVGPDDHFAMALLSLAGFQYLAIALVICASVALLVAVVGIVRKGERGVLPVVAVAWSIVVFTCGLFALLRIN
jgi:hypothetical protein